MVHQDVRVIPTLLFLERPERAAEDEPGVDGDRTTVGRCGKTPVGNRDNLTHPPELQPEDYS